jgi:hypothetical protein
VAVETRVVTPDIPGDLLSCDVPAPAQIVRDSDAADYLSRLYAAASSCARKVDALRAIVTPTQP